MPSVAVLAADGFETIECLTMVDVMRRGGVRATLVSIMPTREVVSSLQIPVTCDALFDEINFDEYDCVVLPGGLPGTTHLGESLTVQEGLAYAVQENLWVAAICAAPFILGELDLLEGRHATCFPGFEKSFPEGAYTGEKVTQDGNIITASGMAQSLPFALELLRTLAGDKAVEKVAEGIECDIPDAMIEEQCARFLEDFKQRLQSQGIPYDQYCKMTNMDEAKFLEEGKEPATRQVRMDLAVNAIIKEEKLEATDEEVEKQYNDLAEKYSMDVNELKKYLDAMSVRTQIIRDKAISVVVDSAKVEKKKAPKKEAEGEAAEGEEKPAKKTAAKKSAKKEEEKAE